MGKSRRKLNVLVCAMAILTAIAGVAVANTTSGNQNPQLRVTASLTPNSVNTGATLHGVISVTNTTSKTRHVSITWEYDTPNSGMGTAMSPIPIKPHATWTHTFNPTSRAAGKYTLIMQAGDAKGSSKTTATAKAS